MSNRETQWLGLDVGGANLKAAHSGGTSRSVPFALWRDPEDLANRLRQLVAEFPEFQSVALTTTAELCDCFQSKAQGVLAVMKSVIQICEGKPLWIWGVDGRFHSPESIMKQPRIAAAANWVALATIAARKLSDECGLLIDIGSTTTDLIPLLDGKVVSKARTDTERLQSGELVYAGVRRTPICALATSLPHRGRDTGLAAELFATTLDVFLTLGDLQENAEDCDTADGKPATIPEARNRLARMVGADREDFSERDATDFAGEAHKVLIDRLVSSAIRVSESLPKSPTVALVSGSGEFLARRVGARAFPGDFRIVALSEIWDQAASDAACARALLDLVATELPTT